MKRLLTIVFATSVLALVVLQTGGCSDTSEQKSMKNLETGVVRIEIDGHRFNIPLRYMYGEAIVKYKRWPTPKKDRVQVGYLNLSMLLPDLKPYYPEDEVKWKELGPGDRIEVSIAKGSRGPDWYQAVLKRTMEGNFYQKEKNIYGLMHFSPKGELSPVYLSIDKNPIYIYCSRPDLVDSPGCSVRSSYLTGVVLDYTYGVKYLPQWRKIDDALKKLFDKFALEAKRGRE